MHGTPSGTMTRCGARATPEASLSMTAGLWPSARREADRLISPPAESRRPGSLEALVGSTVPRYSESGAELTFERGSMNARD